MKDTLIQYKGGGYEGCYWEWNFFAYDSRGKFHNIFTSGRAGIGNEQAAKELLKENDGVFTYNLASETDLAEFARENNPALIRGIVISLEQIDREFANNVFAVCKECGDSIEDSEDMMVHGYKGEEMYCSSCYSMHTCAYCGEFYHESEFDEAGYCVYCAEEECKRIAERELRQNEMAWEKVIQADVAVGIVTV